MESNWRYRCNHRSSNCSSCDPRRVAFADESHSQVPSACFILLETNVRSDGHTSCANHTDLKFSIIVLAVLHITTLSEFTTSNNPGVALALPSVYLQVELFYALLSSAIPALNRWLRNFDTSMGTTWTSAYGSQQYGSNDRADKSVGQSYRMDSINNSKLRPDGPQQDNNAFTPGNREYIASCMHGNNADGHSNHSHDDRSTSSEDMIIRKSVGWKVTYEDHKSPVGHAI